MFHGKCVINLTSLISQLQLLDQKTYAILKGLSTYLLLGVYTIRVWAVYECDSVYVCVCGGGHVLHIMWLSAPREARGQLGCIGSLLFDMGLWNRIHVDGLA